MEITRNLTNKISTIVRLCERLEKSKDTMRCAIEEIGEGQKKGS